MSLHEIISVICDPGSTPRLIELGRGLLEGHPTTIGYVWSTGRITARFAGRSVVLHRIYGPIRKHFGLTLDVSLLDALARACADWARRRTEWAAFYASGAGFPPGYGGGWYYRSPGPNGERITIGTQCVGRASTGEKLQGRDEIVDLYEPISIDRDVLVTSEIWRRGERFGDPDGSLVGLRYVVGSLQIDAQREEAWVHEPGTDNEVFLEPREDAFVAALAALARSNAAHSPDRGGS